MKKNQRKRKNEIRLILFYKNTRILFYKYAKCVRSLFHYLMVYFIRKHTKKEVFFRLLIGAYG